jgi:tRNA(adenine34) deaminase
MREALLEARVAGISGEVPVGALVVSAHGDILARAGNRVESLCDPTAHAEILALRSACAGAGNYRLEGAVLVATLEPCLMCAGALAHARLAGLVFGTADIRAGAVISCLDGLEQPFLNHRTWHMGGICAQDCAAMLREFFTKRR